MREILCRERPPKTCERMILSDNHRPWVAKHFDRLHLLIGDRQQDEGDIELAGDEQVDEVIDVRVLAQRRDRPGSGSCMSRRKSTGSRVCETLWKVPMRSTGEPSSRALLRSARAALSRALITFAWSSRSCPSGVIAILREPRSRVTSRAPTSRSSVAIWPLIADWL